MLIEHGVKYWRFFTIAPIGRAATDNALQLDTQGMRQLMDFIVETRKEGKINATFSCEAYTGPYERKVRDWFYFCRAGITIGSVLIDGSISACPNIDRGFVQGNIYKDNLLDVWENRFQPFRDRSWTKAGQCARCKEYKNCLGGAMHLHHPVSGEITQCHYRTLKGE
ncbi:MAG: SPASM domain-containing protein, partial [Bacteroidales bacterium]|nr:SPASM domain-containing protein [Bacteroidales bacterium]